MRLDKNGSKPAHDYEYFYEGVDSTGPGYDSVAGFL
jgi:hypothetical protein